MPTSTMDAFSSGSELSSAEEVSGDERAPPLPAPKQEAHKRARTHAEKTGEAPAPAPTPAERRTPSAPQPKRARLHAPDDDASSDQEAEREAPRTEPKPKPKPKPPTRPPMPRVAPPTSDEPTAIEGRPRAPAKPVNEPAFGRNMSGWDQLFGPITSAPKHETRAKDATPEQRAAAAEAAAKERETELRERSARERAAKEKEAREKQAQERAMREAAAHEAARAQRLEKRPTSVTTETLAEHRRRLRRAIDATDHLDLLAGCRLMSAFEVRRSTHAGGHGP